MTNLSVLSWCIFFVGTLFSITSSPVSADSAEVNYAKYCAACHGNELQGNFGSSLIDNVWLHGGTKDEIAKTIREGILAKGMPAWGKTLSEDEVLALVEFIQQKGRVASAQ